MARKTRLKAMVYWFSNTTCGDDPMANNTFLQHTVVKVLVYNFQGCFYHLSHI